MIAATKPYFAASIDLTRALLHIFKGIEKRLINEPVDMILSVAEDEDEDENDNNDDNGNEDMGKDDEGHLMHENEMNIDHKDDDLNLDSKGVQDNYSFQKYDSFKVENEVMHSEACVGHDKDLRKMLENLPDYSSWIDRVILLKEKDRLYI